MAYIWKTIANMFTVGNTEKEMDQKDGYISSMLIVTSFTGILFEFFREYIYPTSWYSHKQYASALLLLFVLLLVSLVLWVVLCALAKYQTSRCLSTPRNDPVSTVVQIFYGVFGVGTMIVHLLNFIIDVRCYRENQLTLPEFKLQKNYFYMISSVGRALQILFICVQFISIRSLSKFQLKRGLLVNYFLSVILLTNVGVYLFNAFRLVYGIILHEHTFGNFTTHSNKTSRSCYRLSPITSELLLPWKGILFPLQQEYHLLSICLIVSMLPKLGNFHLQKKNHVGTAADNEFYQTARDDKERPKSLIRIRYKIILISILSTAMFIPGLIILLLRLTTYYDGSLFIVYQWCKALPTILVVVVILKGFHIIRKQETSVSVAENYEGYLMDNDTIYILTSAGAMIYNGIGLMFSITVSHFKVNSLRFTLNMVEIYYQTILIISLKKYGAKRVIMRLQYLLLFLLFPNGLFWMSDVFSLLPNFDDAYKTMIGPTWPSVKQTIVTLSGFYRFQSFIFLYRFWKLGGVQ